MHFTQLLIQGQQEDSKTDVCRQAFPWGASLKVHIPIPSVLSGLRLSWISPICCPIIGRAQRPNTNSIWFQQNGDVDLLIAYNGDKCSPKHLTLSLHTQLEGQQGGLLGIPHGMLLGRKSKWLLPLFGELLSLLQRNPQPQMTVSVFCPHQHPGCVGSDIHEIKIRLVLFLLSFLINYLQKWEVRMRDSEIVTIKGSFIKERCHSCNHTVPVWNRSVRLNLLKTFPFLQRSKWWWKCWNLFSPISLIRATHRVALEGTFDGKYLKMEKAVKYRLKSFLHCSPSLMPFKHEIIIHSMPVIWCFKYYLAFHCNLKRFKVTLIF